MSVFGRSYGGFDLRARSIKDGKEIVLQVGRATPSTTGSRYVSEDRKSLGLNLLDDIKTSTVSAKLSQDLAPRRRGRRSRNTRRPRQYRKSLRTKAPDGRRGRRQALRRQPAEGRPGEVDVHRPGPADPRRADPRHRRGRQVRDLRHHPAARRPGEGRHRHLLGAARAARALATASTPSSKAPSRASSTRTDASPESLMKQHDLRTKNRLTTDRCRTDSGHKDLQKNALGSSSAGNTRQFGMIFALVALDRPLPDPDRRPHAHARTT